MVTTFSNTSNQTKKQKKLVLTFQLITFQNPNSMTGVIQLETDKITIEIYWDVRLKSIGLTSTGGETTFNKFFTNMGDKG